MLEGLVPTCRDEPLLLIPNKCWGRLISLPRLRTKIAKKDRGNAPYHFRFMGFPIALLVGDSATRCNLSSALSLSSRCHA